MSQAGVYFQMHNSQRQPLGQRGSALVHGFLWQQKRMSPINAATIAASTTKLRERNTMRIVLLVVAAS